MEWHLVVDALRAVLLVLGGWRLALDDLHLHRARQEQLLAVLLLRLLLGLALDRVGDALVHSLWTRGHSLVSGHWHNDLRGNLRRVDHVMVRCAGGGRLWRLLVVVLIQLMDVQTISSLVHTDISTVLVVHRRLDLDGLRSIAFLSVQLASIHRLNIQDAAVTALLTRSVVGRGDDCLPRWVEAKVRLVHQLVVETRVYVRVVVLYRLVVDVLLRLAVLEQFVQDGFLLVVVDAHTFSLDCTVELMLTLVLIIVTWGVSGLHTLRIL